VVEELIEKSLGPDLTKKLLNKPQRMA